jgi:hypothetical protein
MFSFWLRQLHYYPAVRNYCGPQVTSEEYDTSGPRGILAKYNYHFGFSPNKAPALSALNGSEK